MPSQSPVMYEGTNPRKGRRILFVVSYGFNIY
jgi:hypothetical protein